MGRNKRSRVQKIVRESYEKLKARLEESVEEVNGELAELGGQMLLEVANKRLLPAQVSTAERPAGMFRAQMIDNCAVTQATRGVIFLTTDIIASLAHATEHESIEWAVTLHGRRSEDGLQVWVQDIDIPEQERSSAEVDIKTGIDFGNSVVGILHSHHSMGAFFSGTDEKELNPRFPISIVVAKYNTAKGGRKNGSSDFAESAMLGFAYLAVGKVRLPCGRMGEVKFKIAPVENETMEVVEDWPGISTPHMEVPEAETEIGDCPAHQLSYLSRFHAVERTECGAVSNTRPVLRPFGENPDLREALPEGKQYATMVYPSRQSGGYGEYDWNSLGQRGYGGYSFYGGNALGETPVDRYKRELQERKEWQAAYPQMEWDVFNPDLPKRNQANLEMRALVTDYFQQRYDNESFQSWVNRVEVIRKYTAKEPLNTGERYVYRHWVFRSSFKDGETWASFWQRWEAEGNSFDFVDPAPDPDTPPTD